MEQEQDNSGVSRGQNLLHVLPEDAALAAAALRPLLDRIDPSVAAPQMLVVASDADLTAAIAAELSRDTHPLRVLGATDPRRAARVLQAAGGAQVVVGAPNALVRLLQGASLKLDATRVAVFAWVDEAGERDTAALESLMADVPKDAARVVITSDVTPATDQLVERYARRARRLRPAAESRNGVALSYVSTSESGRLSALRRTLDALDPESALVIARSQSSRDAVSGLLRSLGYEGDAAPVRVAEAPDASARVVIVYELPSEPDDLRALAGTGGARTVAIVTPRQITALRRLAGGTIAPLQLPEAAARARTREDTLRDELREVLSAGQYSRELLALEPLLEAYDGVEIAAAAMRLLDAERLRASAPATARTSPPLTRLYFNIGSMDEARPGDLVGAITNEAEISRADLGRVDVRERHSTVEVATPVANAVVEKLTGIQMKGRRLMVRVDAERPRDGGGGRPAGGPRGGRPDRGDRGERGDRGGRPDRGDRGDRGERRGGPPRDRRTRPVRPRPQD